MKTLRLAMKNWISFTKSKITWRFGSYLAGREPILLPRFAQNRKSFIPYFINLHITGRTSPSLSYTFSAVEGRKPSTS